MPFSSIFFDKNWLGFTPIDVFDFNGVHYFVLLMGFLGSLVLATKVLKAVFQSILDFFEWGSD